MAKTQGKNQIHFCCLSLALQERIVALDSSSGPAPAPPPLLPPPPEFLSWGPTQSTAKECKGWERSILSLPRYISQAHSGGTRGAPKVFSINTESTPHCLVQSFKERAAAIVQNDREELVGPGAHVVCQCFSAYNCVVCFHMLSMIWRYLEHGSRTQM